MTNKEGIRLKLLPPLVIVILALVGGSVWILSKDQNNRIQETKKATAQRVEQLLKDEMYRDVSMMSATLEAIVRDPQFLSAFQSQNREALLKRGRPLFSRLKKQFKITHFYFHRPDHINLVRMHKELRGDLINRQTLKEASRLDQPSSGLEQGPTGNPVLRVVYPWHTNFPKITCNPQYIVSCNTDIFNQSNSGELVGFVELGKEFEDIASNISNLLKVDLIVAVDKKFLVQERWEKRNKKLGRQSAWNKFSDHVIIDQTIETVPTKISEKMMGLPSQREHSITIKEDNRTKQALFIPFDDINDTNIGYVVILNDITKIKNNAEKSIRNLSISGSFLGIALIALFYYILSKVDKDLEQRRIKIIQSNTELEKSQRQLFEYNQTLENKVEERTIQLAQSIKNAEEAQHLAEKASETKSIFLANMSHELRTPMNAIIGYSDILIEEVDDLRKELVLPALQKIQASGKHLLRTISEILDISKIEAGEIELYLETFGLKLLIEEVAAMIRPMCRKNGNQFVVHYSKENECIEIYSDIARVRQSLSNLLSNACKFTHAGIITLSIDTYHMNSREWISFAVADTGVGMSQLQITKLFQPFSQADASTTRKYGGTGLGLAITKRFCEMLGGDVTVKSVLDQGSTFTIHLPIQAQNPIEQEKPSFFTEDRNNSGRGLGGGLNILLIDDDQTIHDLLKHYLVPKGHFITSTYRGIEGIQAAQHIKPDIIVLDVMMPEMDGWEVIKHLKVDSELANIPVIMMTMVDDESFGKNLGASEYLLKPINLKKMSEVLSKYQLLIV